MDNGREAHHDPLLELTHGALRLSHTQSAASLHADRPVNNDPARAQVNLRSKATDGAPKVITSRDNAKNKDNGMLEAQQDSYFDTTNGAPKEPYHIVDQRGKRKSAFQNTLENFSPNWFVIPMNTGILGILMHLLPYEFRGLFVLSTIMYLAALTFFVIICSMTIMRWILYTKAVQQKAAASIDEISYLGAAPIAFLTITSLTGLIVSNAYWGGHAWSIVAYVMWWFGMAWMFITCTDISPSLYSSTLTISIGVGVCITLFRTKLIDDRSMTPSPVLAAVGVSTAANVGAQVINYSYDISPRLAVPVIIVAYLLGGLALWLSIILYAIFFHRLMASGWPEPAKRPALLILVSYSWMSSTFASRTS